MSNSKYHVPNLERALVIMEKLSEHIDGLTLTELVDEMNFSKNSIYRITATLTNFGYLNRNEDTKKFSLSRKLLALGFSTISEQNIMEVSLDLMRSLSDKVNATVLIGTLIGTEGIIVGQVPGGYPFQLTVPAGTKFDLHSGAPGKIFLSHMKEHESENLIKSIKLRRFTDYTITSRTALRKELEVVREKGYATDHNEGFNGINCIAAPIFNSHNECIASLWITGAEDQVKPERFEELAVPVMDFADQISKRLGYKILNTDNIGQVQ